MNSVILFIDKFSDMITCVLYINNFKIKLKPVIAGLHKFSALCFRHKCAVRSSVIILTVIVTVVMYGFILNLHVYRRQFSKVVRFQSCQSFVSSYVYHYVLPIIIVLTLCTNEAVVVPLKIVKQTKSFS